MESIFKHISMSGIVIVLIGVAIGSLLIKPPVYFAIFWLFCGLFGLYISGRTLDMKEKAIEKKVELEVIKQLKNHGLL